MGEIHIDHCRVSYAKDRFDRTDPAWEEMVTLVRGEGPLRPQKATILGFQGNESPLFRLFTAYRRTSPQSKVAGAWKRILIVKDNNRASDMASKFHEGHPEYHDDTKWWELVEEADRELLRGQPGGPLTGSDGDSKDDESGGLVDDILGGSDEPGTAGDGVPEDEPEEKKNYPRDPMPSLTQRYVHSASGHTWSIEAFSVDPRDQDLGQDLPWRLLMADTATRTYHFLVSMGHEAFRSMTLTPRDALLMELAWMTADYLRDTPDPPTLSAILAEFRQTYGEDENIDARQMQPDAVEILGVIARAFLKNVPQADRASLFNDLSSDDQQSIMRVGKPKGAAGKRLG